MLALSLLNLYGGKCPKGENVDQDACMQAVQFAHIHIPVSVYLPPEIDWNANLAVMQRCLKESDKTEAVRCKSTRTPYLWHRASAGLYRDLRPDRKRL